MYKILSVVLAGLIFFACFAEMGLGKDKKKKAKTSENKCIDGAVKIGKQVWMCKNLDVSTYRNGDTIRHAQTVEEWEEAGEKGEGAWCYNDNSNENGKVYGKLYNWYAVNDPRGLAPEGWHVPTDEEWNELTEYLGGGQEAGGKLKEIGTKHWESPYTGATNQSGCSALPGGWRYDGGAFGTIGGYGYWWSATEHLATSAWCMFLTYSSYHIPRYHSNKAIGFSVRCVRD